MFDMDTLETLIAVVVVILVLSLMVQSIQAAIKKLLQIKSKQIEDSLVDLFEQVLDTPGNTRWYNDSPFIRTLTPRVDSPADKADAAVQKLYKAVMQRFGDLGRIAQTGSKALESLSKEDLSKVIATVGLDDLHPGAKQRFEDACQSVREVRALLDEIERVEWSGDAQLQWARLQALIVPLLNDVTSLFDKGAFQGTLVRHLVDLRRVDLDSVLTIVGNVREQIAKDAAAAPVASKRQGDFDEILSRLDVLVRKLSAIPGKLDEALTPIRARIAAIETWYDTVMQSFEERYARGMRTWSIVIGLIITVTFNANIFRIYQRLAVDDAMRQGVMSRAQSILTESAAPLENNRKVLNDTQASEQDKTAARKNLNAIHEQLTRDMSSAAATYQGFGFRPIWADWNEVHDEPLQHALGWLLMALLLSLGAPFWHDALASLLGFKNLLQQKGQISNVEQQSGQGSTQSQ